MRKSRYEHDGLLQCSFCSKTQKQVKKLIAGPGVYICDECLNLCNEILRDEVGSDEAGKVTRGMMIPADAPQEDMLDELARAAGQFLPLEKHLEELVQQLRKKGATWASIGEALGMTRQAAWARFSGEE